MSTDQPRIAIIGSPWLRGTDGQRLQSDIATRHEAKAGAAAEELGRELARADCKLLVYSAEEHSVEPAVVRGFVAVKKERHNIEFRHPRGGGGSFPEQALSEEPINDRADGAADWVVSFYGSLRDADGVLLLGGRATVLIAGHVSIAFGRPVAAVAAFDGSAADVWKELKQVGDLTDEEYDAMGRTWGPSSAKAIVGSLVRRHTEATRNAQKREQEELARKAELEGYRKRERERSAAWPTWVVTSLSFLAMLTLIVLGQTWSTTGTGFLGAFIAALTLAGVAGAGLRVLRTDQTEHYARALLYGAVAGFVFSFLYLAPQLAGDQSLLAAVQITPAVRWQTALAPILALTGGLAADSVLTSLQKSGESRATQLPAVPLSPTEVTEPERGERHPRKPGKRKG